MAEFAGLGLALLPLLVSAAEHYNDCLRPLSRYKGFSDEAKQFLQLLSIQRTIYRSHCRLLLRNVVHQDVASAMLDQKDHPHWSDGSLEQNLSHTLGEATEACLTVLEMIGDSLTAIQSEGQEIIKATEIEQQPGNSPTGGKVWRKYMRTKLRFSISESRLHCKLETLRAMNGDFKVLTSHFTKATQSHPAIPSEPNSHVSKLIERYKVIGKAAQNVYNALGKACTQHPAHLAHFCVEVEEVSRAGSNVPEVRFKMAFTPSTSQSAPIWLVVDAVIGEASGEKSEPAYALIGLEESLKRAIDSHADHCEMKAKKRVGFESSTENDHWPNMVSHPFSLGGRLNPDFCDYLRHCLRQPLKADVCIATLEITKEYKSFVFPSPTTLHSQTRHAISLRQLVLSTCPQIPCSVMSLFERLRLAKTLAIAILRYHDTSWIPLSWRSDDILFFEEAKASPPSPLIDLAAPHLNTTIKVAPMDLARTPVFSHGGGPRDQLSNILGGPRHQLLCNLGGPRNQLLYSLGILFLEIAYSKPWESLKRPSQNKDADSKTGDFLEARRLAISGRSGLGEDYERIVEQLIECDFGCGADLSKPQLQAAIHRDVIVPLERLERGLQNLQLGA